MKILDKILKKGCKCGECSTEKETEKNILKEDIMTIKILGTGCKNCMTLTENVKSALNELKIEADIKKITDFEEISSYGIMSTPGLVINEKVVSYGKILKNEELKKIIGNL